MLDFHPDDLSGQVPFMTFEGSTAPADAMLQRFADASRATPRHVYFQPERLSGFCAV